MYPLPGTDAPPSEACGCLRAKGKLLVDIRSTIAALVTVARRTHKAPSQPVTTLYTLHTSTALHLITHTSHRRLVSAHLSYLLLSLLLSVSSLPFPFSCLFCSLLSLTGPLCVSLLAPRRSRTGLKGEAALGYSEQGGKPPAPQKGGRYPTHTGWLKMAAQHR